MDGWALVSLAILAWVALLQYVGNGVASTRNKRWPPKTSLPSPPSPPHPFPLLGHLHQLLLSNQPLHQWLHSMSLQYGPIVSLQMGSVPTLLVSSPDIARLVLHTHDLAFASRSTCSSAAQRFTYNFAGLVHTPYGPHWRKVKELYMTKLFNSKRLQYFKPFRAAEVRGLIHSIWKDALNAQNLRMKLQVGACNIISTMVLGKNFDDLSSITQISGSMLFDALYESLNLIGTADIGDFLPALKFLDIQRLKKRTDDTFEKLDIIYQRIIDDRRNSRAINDSYDENDFLDTLLSLHVDVTKGETNLKQICFTDDNIKAIFWDMFVGGIDTSTIAVEWGLAELIRHKEIMRTLQEEIDLVVGNSRFVSEDDIANLPYLQATVKEIMRLHPVAPIMIPHESRKPCEIAGFYVAEKTRLIVNVWSLSMDENSWNNPLEFCPQRFLGSDLDLKGHHFQLLPFGAGRRACPAINLGLINVYLMLASLVHSFEWSLPLGVEEIDMSESFGMTLHRTNPLVLMATPRLSRELYESHNTNQ